MHNEVRRVHRLGEVGEDTLEDTGAGFARDAADTTRPYQLPSPSSVSPVASSKKWDVPAADGCYLERLQPAEQLSRLGLALDDLEAPERSQDQRQTAPARLDLGRVERDGARAKVGVQGVAQRTPRERRRRGMGEDWPEEREERPSGGRFCSCTVHRSAPGQRRGGKLVRTWYSCPLELAQDGEILEDECHLSCCCFREWVV
jgi:hypothetical protein